MLTGSSCGILAFSVRQNRRTLKIDVVTAVAAFKTIAREIGQRPESAPIIQQA
jgi:hypothetical protein